MKRLFLLFLIGIASLAAAFTVKPAGAAKAPAAVRIAVVNWDETNGAFNTSLAALKETLLARGYPPGAFDDFTVKGDAQAEKAAAAATLLQALQARGYDLFVLAGTDLTVAARTIITTTPVVFVTVLDPVAAGLVKDLNAPGGPFTGESHHAPIDRVLKIFVNSPTKKMKSLGAVHQRGSRAGLADIRAMEALAKRSGIRVIVREATDANEIAAATRALLEDGANGIILSAEPLISGSGKVIVALANAGRTPTLAFKDYQVEDWGATIGCIVDFHRLGKNAGLKADAILRDGKTPAEIPVGYVDACPVWINQRMIRLHRLPIRPAVLKQADRVFNP